MSKSFFWANVQKFWRLIFKAVKFPWYFCRYVILYQFAYISFNKAKLGIKAPKNLQLAIAALEKAAQISRRWNLERDISKNIMNQNDNQWRLIFKAIKLCWYLLVSITIYSQGIVRIKMANLGIDRSDNFQLAIAALEEAAQIQRHLQLAISVSKKIFDQSARIDKSFGLAEEHLSATLNELGSAYVTQAELGIDSANNLQLAIAALQESEEITRGLGLERDLSDTLNNLGNGYVRQADLGIDSANNLQLAIAAYGESAEIMRGLGLERELSATLNNLSLAYINQAKLGIDSANNLQLAIAALQESEEIRRRLGLERELSATLNNLGNGYVRQAELGIDSTNNLQLAIAALQESAEITRGLGLETDLSDTLNNLGSAYVTQAELGIDSANNLQLAIATLQESEEITRGLGLERDLSATLMNLGSAYVNQAELGIDSTNNLQLAIAALQESEEITRGLGLERDLSDTLNNLSLAYINQAKLGIDSANNLQLTIAALQESEEIRRRLGLERDLSGTLMNLGSAYIKQAELGMDSANNLQLAIAALQESKEIKRRLGLERDLSTTLNNLGFAYVTQAGDLQAIAAYREAGYTAKELYNAITNSLQAIAAYREALTYQNPTILPVDVLRTARNLGNLGFNQGDWHVALEGYQIAMTAIDYSRTQRTNQAERDKIVAESIGIYENAIQAAINLNDIATALKIVERVRAKRLVDLMATADLYQDGNIPPQIKQRLQQLDDLDNQIANLQKQLEDKPDTDGLKTRQLRAAINVPTEIAELERQKEHIFDQLSNEDEVVAKLRQVQPPQLQDFHPLLPEKTTLLSFYTTKNDTHILILHSGETQPHCFTCQGQGYEILQQWIRKTWTDLYIEDKKKNKWTAQMPHTLAEVAQRLEIERLITEHLQGTEELLIVPHLYLHQIPFAALPIAEGYLGDKFLIRYAPSLQVLGFCYNPKRLSAEDGYNYATAENATADLPFSGFEGAKIAEIFAVPQEQRLIREQATRTAYRQLLQQASHIVSSHHAQSRFDNPLESGLKLSDGNISVSQLFSPGWRFPQLQEVFLSCCETGLFLPETITDEPVAVSTGFLCAGASGVIASQWAVYDCSAALLSILYHQQRQQGLNRPRALQAAQRQMRQMTAAEFKKYYQKQLERHIKGEKELVSHEIYSKEQQGLNTEQETELLTKYADAEKTITRYANYKGLPFQHPVHWAAMGCYGLG